MRWQPAASRDPCKILNNLRRLPTCFHPYAAITQEALRHLQSLGSLHSGPSGFRKEARGARQETGCLSQD